MKTSPKAKKYRIKGGYCYDETDFIAYLNQYIFPEKNRYLLKI